jgi:hypothetical protein
LVVPEFISKMDPQNKTAKNVHESMPVVIPAPRTVRRRGV